MKTISCLGRSPYANILARATAACGPGVFAGLERSAMRARNVGIGPPKLEAPSGSNCLQRQEASDISDEIHSAAEVFIVDDDAAICRMLSLALRRSGYQVACFADGASFVAAARIRTPACILLDLH